MTGDWGSSGISKLLSVESSASSKEFLAEPMYEAVWKEDECELGVKLPSEAVANDSSSVERDCQSWKGKVRLRNHIERTPMPS